MVPGVRFDADQAIVGLMAKHISEGRAFPVFFYGQSYLLGARGLPGGAADVAARADRIASSSCRVLLMNVAAGLLVVWLAHRDSACGRGWPPFAPCRWPCRRSSSEHG